MNYDPLDYHQLVQEAFRDIVRRSLEIVAEQGLPGGHHFYITFRTQAPGVVLSPELVARYPDEMTVVLEHQFRDLHVDGDAFSVGLSFAGVWQEITIPYSALSSFVDPGAEFGLRFTTSEEEFPNEEPEHRAAQEGTVEQSAVEESAALGGDAPLAEVVSLDAFRKR